MKDLWFCARGNMDGRPSVIRGRQGLSQIANEKTHGRLLRMTWNYDVIDADEGLPSPELSETMAGFENAVFDEFDKDTICLFFCVFLHNGVKEWLGYSSDIQETCNRINTALAGHEVYPVEMTVQDDVEWQEYNELLRQTGMGGPPAGLTN